MIDWVLAEKLGAYIAGTGTARLPRADLTALTAESERRVVAYTGLVPARPLPPPEGISRRDWVASNLDAMRTLLDPVLERAGKGMGPLKPALQIGIGAVMTAEVGLIVGYLGQRVLGQYELVLLEKPVSDHPPRLLFVLPNLGQAVQAFGANEDEFMTWVALHEVTHAVQFGGVPWLHGHLAGLVKELLRSAELRMERERRFRVPSRAELSRAGRLLRQGDMISLITNDAERATLDRIQATMAVIEGHAEHVMDVVAPDLLPSLPRLRAALDERRKTQSLLSRLVARLLGLELKLRQYERGKYFCDEVAKAGGADALRHVFSGPEALPTLAEIDDPPAWLRRTGLTESPAAA
jgi:coenzyme F420 biosynthesis associated uncharacterized protein